MSVDLEIVKILVKCEYPLTSHRYFTGEWNNIINYCNKVHNFTEFLVNHGSLII